MIASTNSLVSSRGGREYNLYAMQSVVVSSMTWVVAAMLMSV
jgi:hypothetical protein